MQGLTTQALLTLTAREERVLRLRNGLNCAEHTVGEVARQFGVTEERVRQVEAKALRKLKRPYFERVNPPEQFGPPDPSLYNINIQGPKTVKVVEWLSLADGGLFAKFNYGGKEWWGPADAFSRIQPTGTIYLGA